MSPEHVKSVTFYFLDHTEMWQKFTFKHLYWEMILGEKIVIGLFKSFSEVKKLIKIDKTYDSLHGLKNKSFRAFSNSLGCVSAFHFIYRIQKIASAKIDNF